MVKRLLITAQAEQKHGFGPDKEAVAKFSH